MLHAILFASLLGAQEFQVTLRPAPARSAGIRAASASGAAEAVCDDGSVGGTLVQRVDAYYGNRFSAPCPAARVLGASFEHLGYGLAGPYSFRLHLLDGSCHETGVTPVLTTPGAPDSLVTAQVDLSSDGWCVQGDFHLLLEPLTCADGSTGRDCFPAVVVDATADGDPTTHCATVSAVAGIDRECFAARTTDGRYLDFGLRVQVQCEAPECTSAVESSTWSRMKQLYRDPAPTTRE